MAANTDDDEGRPRLSRAFATTKAAVSCGALAITGAIAVGFALAIEGLMLGGFPMAFVGALGGPVLGAALGLGLGLRVPEFIAYKSAERRMEEVPPVELSRILRLFPGGRAGALLAWGLALGLLASPYPLLAVGGLPPLTLGRLSVTGLVAVLCFLQCARRGSFWPAIVLPLWPVLTLVAMGHHYPCWRESNADWCGHSCDGPADEKCRDRDFGAPEATRGEDDARRR